MRFGYLMFKGPRYDQTRCGGDFLDDILRALGAPRFREIWNYFLIAGNGLGKLGDFSVPWGERCTNVPEFKEKT